MHKLQNGSQVTGRPVRKPRVGTRGYFSESNDQGAPSHPGQDWFNDCIDEFANALEQADIPYDPQRLDHLARAIAEAKANWGADIVSQSEAQAGTATTARKWTAQRVRQAIVAWWDSIPKGTAFNKNFGSTAGTVCPGNDSRLSDAREWLANTVSQAEAEAGESTAPRKWTAQRVRESTIKALREYGIGADSTYSRVRPSNLDYLVVSGNYQAFGGAPGAPVLLEGYVQVFSWEGRPSTQQLVLQIYTTIRGARRFFRTLSIDGEWEEWVEFVHSGNETQVGVNQSYENLTSSRTSSTIYTNNTKKPILVAISTTEIGGGFDDAHEIRANSSAPWVVVGPKSGTARIFVCYIVPVGYQYRYRGANSGLINWSELR